MNLTKFQSCIDACLACAVECNHCITNCLEEKDVKMMQNCINLDRQCTVICLATAQMLSIGGAHATHLCAECAEICEACARECAGHLNDHCKRCAEACLRCARECNNLINAAA